MKSFPHDLKHGSGINMTLDSSRLLLAFKEPQEFEDIKKRLGDIGLELEDVGEKKKTGLHQPTQAINHTDQRFWVRSHTRESIDAERFSAVENLFGEAIDWIGPVYKLPNINGRKGLLCPLPNVLVIKLNPQMVSGTDIEAGDILEELKEVPEKSKYLGDYRYYIVEDPKKHTSYELQRILLKKETSLVLEVRFENMPMLVPLAVDPGDPLYPQQWNMTRIQAGGPGITGWDISTGVGAVVVCVLDSGCDLTHPDLTFSTPGIDLGTMLPDGSPNPHGFGHGTCCAGLAAATFDNGLGVSGVAGNCQIMPIAFQDLTDAELAAGINYAADNGAHVISMSIGNYTWDPTIIDPAIQHAFDSDVVMCACTQNFDGAITYPATNPLVMACGASDQIDDRKSPASPDGEGWGSNFGPEMSVVAPGVLLPSTDIQGTGGYNNAAGAAGDYNLAFGGTSGATPQVAGLAALLRSEYPTLTNVQVRDIIERTAEKVGVIAYVETPGYPNGTWNQEMGYGRINVLRALDFADVMIKDWPGDTGTEPSTPTGGNFWDFSDVVVRISDDDVFVPDDPTQASNVERGQTNHIYVRVTNNGPSEARNVVVNARLTPFVGLQFVYPADWTTIDATHVSPTPVTATFATIPAGDSVIAKFTVSSAQVEDLWGWEHDHPWHPCLLAEVNADNDYAFGAASLAGSPIVVSRNNLAQRNLSLINVFAGAFGSFPVIAGSLHNAERVMEVRVDRSQLPKEMKLWLSLDDDGRAFPLVDFSPPSFTATDGADSGIVFLERTRIEATIACCRGVLTLEKGSRFDCPPSVKIGKVSVRGGVVTIRDDKRYVEIRENVAVLRMEKQPNQLYPFTLQTSIPANAQKGQQYIINIGQRNQREETVGGATVVYVVE
jgi:hypothetical protein